MVVNSYQIVTIDGHQLLCTSQYSPAGYRNQLYTNNDDVQQTWLTSKASEGRESVVTRRVDSDSDEARGPTKLAAVELAVD